MGLWLHLANPSEPNPSQSNLGWHVLEQYSSQSRVLVPDDMHNVDSS